jgi:hypothetical protein
MNPTTNSAKRAPVDEVLRLVEQYRRRYQGWTVKHFYSKYREQKGQRSYNFVRLTLQREGWWRKPLSSPSLPLERLAFSIAARRALSREFFNSIGRSPALTRFDRAAAT